MKPLYNVVSMWLQDPLLKKIFNVFIENNIDIRFVGGCVRDALMNKTVLNFDLAVAAPYEKLESIVDKASFKVILRSPQHQSFIVQAKNHQIDLTSLRQDTSCDGRHAQTEFTADWTVDARRRDFTINALYCDKKGNIFDPLQGFQDIEQKKIRFIGNPIDRIKEDSLRILRFFRFFSQLEGFSITPEEANVCATHADLLKNLSRERFTKEFIKLLEGPQMLQSLKIMQNVELLDKIIPHAQVKVLENILSIMPLKNLEPLYCLIALCWPADPSKLRFFSLSRNDLRNIQRIQKWINLFSNVPELHYLKMLRHQENDRGYWFIAAMVKTLNPNSIITTDLLQSVSEWHWPPFPLNGKDLMELGYKQGPLIKKILNDCYYFWLNQSDPLPKEGCFGWIQKNFLLRL